MSPIFCFIDDSAFELDVFLNDLAPLIKGVEFMVGADYESVRRQVGRRYPCLFLLDLYGRDPELPVRAIPDRAGLESRLMNMGSLDNVYNGLEQASGDPTNEYLKRLFHLADEWRKLFHQTAGAAGQNTKYGLGNLKKARHDFPAAAAVAYTRKSMIWDAEEVLAAGIDGLNLKPDGPSDGDIRAATRARVPQLLQSWTKTVTLRFSKHTKELALWLCRKGLSGDLENLDRPERLSPQAVQTLGADNLLFLDAATDWRTWVGMESLLDL